MAGDRFPCSPVATWALVLCARCHHRAPATAPSQSVSKRGPCRLPRPANAGRDLGIINIASAVPQVIGAPIAGLWWPGGGYRGLLSSRAVAVGAARSFARPVRAR